MAADIEYTQSPEGSRLVTNMAGMAGGGAGGGGLGNIGSLYEEMLRQKMKDQADAKRAAMIAAQPRQGAILGGSGGRAPSYAEQAEQNHNLEMQRMQREAMQQQMRDQQYERAKARNPVHDVEDWNETARRMQRGGMQNIFDRGAQAQARRGMPTGDLDPHGLPAYNPGSHAGPGGGEAAGAGGGQAGQVPGWSSVGASNAAFYNRPLPPA